MGFSGATFSVESLGLSDGLGRTEASCREIRFFLGGGTGGWRICLGGSGMMPGAMALTTSSWPCSVVLRGLSPGLSGGSWGGSLSGDALERPGLSPSATVPLSAFPALWSSRETFSEEMRRLGGAAGTLFFRGTDGAGAGCKELGPAPGFISSSLRGPRPASGGGSLSQAAMSGWLGWSGGPGAWGARWGADTGGAGGRHSGDGEVATGREAGRQLAKGGAGVGEGPKGPGAWRGGAGGGGAGRRGAHLEVGEVAQEVGGDRLEGQHPGGGWQEGRAWLQSSMKIGFTNHRRSLPTDSSISHEQFSSWVVDLGLEAGGGPGAGPGGSAGLPPPCWGFNEESQKPRPRLEMVSRSVKLLASRMAWGSLSVKGSKSLLTQ